MFSIQKNSLSNKRMKKISKAQAKPKMVFRKNKMTESLLKMRVKKKDKRRIKQLEKRK